MMAFKVLSLLLVSLSFVLMEENGTRDNTKNSRFLNRRYSEGTLASDYSRTLDNMLKKNFVEWLLNRRENRIDNSLEPSKREVKLPALQERNEGIEVGAKEAKECISWLLSNVGRQRLPLPNGLEDWKNILKQEFMSLLISADLCKAMIM
ncbi:glucagon-1 [Anolis carolinensis]|uniref:Gastric inhibitory polypeptide n=1 Tax=Anolis carolinensis TaxID=28377 RepID=G1KF75_ANOCA|nr:PREDICTED: glucagon-1 isoform X2 [Anolis carolinensis]|eukprot:XP_008111709.1 PREDICTED: glucagon-1 isoform X2 [Anolis carolinensis]